MGNGNSTESSSEGDFKICINASTDSSETLIEAQGGIEDFVTRKDLTTFQVENLREAAAKLPREAFLDGYYLVGAFIAGGTAEQNHEFYVVKKWRPLKKTVRPVKTKVVKITYDTVIVANRKFVNNSSVRAKYNVGVTHEEQHSVNTTWSSKIEANANLKIDYKIQANSTADINFQSSWGKDFHQSKTITVGSQTGLEVELDPGQEVVAKLRVTRYTMDVEVTFEASMEGDIICRYESFWNLFTPHILRADITDVLRVADLPPAVTTSEILKINFCSDGEILLSNS